MLISLLIAYICLFTLSSCKPLPIEDYIGIAKVDIISDIAKEKCFLELDVYTGINIRKIDIIPSLKMTKVEKDRYDVLLRKGDKLSEGYLHRFRINFLLTSLSLTKITFQANESEYAGAIGRFSCETFKQSTDKIPTDVVMTKFEQDEYLLGIQVFNNLDRSLYLSDMERVSIPKSHTITLTTIPSSKALIYPSNIQVYQNLKVRFSEKYYQVEGLIKMIFVTNLQKEYIYASYYLSRTPTLEKLQREGIDVESLEQVKLN